MKKGTAITFALGVFAGLTLCGPAAQAATNLTATLSNQPIYVDGQRVSITAYQIGWNNYVKLRDVGEAVGFNVYWDGRAVQVESGKLYTGINPAANSYSAPPAQQAAAAPTEEAVQAALRTLREQYPNNTVWPSPYRSTSGGPYGAVSSNCAGWAILCSDAAFGNLPWRRVNNPSWDQIRAGDLVEYSNAQGHHVVVVVSKTDDAMAITDSGTTQKAYWGGKYFRWWLEEQSGLEVSQLKSNQSCQGQTAQRGLALIISEGRSPSNWEAQTLPVLFEINLPQKKWLRRWRAGGPRRQGAARAQASRECTSAHLQGRCPCPHMPPSGGNLITTQGGKSV